MTKYLAIAVVVGLPLLAEGAQRGSVFRSKSSKLLEELESSQETLSIQQAETLIAVDQIRNQIKTNTWERDQALKAIDQIQSRVESNALQQQIIMDAISELQGEVEANSSARLDKIEPEPPVEPAPVLPTPEIDLAEVISLIRHETQTNALKQSAEMNRAIERLTATFSEQRARDLTHIESNNRMLLMTVGSFGGLSLLAFVYFSFVQSRIIKRVTSTALVRRGPDGVDGDFEGFSEAFSGPPQGREHSDFKKSQASYANSLSSLESKIAELESSVGGDSNQIGPAKKPEGAAPSFIETTVEVLSKESVMEIFGEGQILMESKQLEEALDCFERVLKHAPTHLDAWLNKGKVLDILGRSDEALAAYDYALQIDPDQKIAHVGKGRIYHKLKRFEEADACYAKVREDSRYSVS